MEAAAAEATHKIFSDYDEFQKETGLIDDVQKLKEIGAVDAIGEPDENGTFDTDLLANLKAFCLANPQFHLATVTSDSDESEVTACENRAKEKGLNWDEMSDDEQESFRQAEEIFAYTIDNSIRFVNRMSFFLCDGNADPNLFLEEISH